MDNMRKYDALLLPASEPSSPGSTIAVGTSGPEEELLVGFDVDDGAAGAEGASDSGTEDGATCVDDGAAGGVSSVAIPVGSNTEIEEAEVADAATVDDGSSDVDGDEDEDAIVVMGTDDVGVAVEDSTREELAAVDSAVDSAFEDSAAVLVAGEGSSVEDDGKTEVEVGLLSELVGDDEGRDVTEEAAGLACAIGDE